MEKTKLLHSEITEKVIGCAMKVHTHFGLGFPEIIYKRDLLIELDKAGIYYRSEEERNIFYDRQLIGKRRLDILIEDQVLVEIKALKEVDKSCYNQVLNYLKVFDLEVGLLLNFGAESLHFKRFVNFKK